LAGFLGIWGQILNITVFYVISSFQGIHASWKVFDFFPDFSMPWKVMQNQFGPGKSWELRLKFLESASNFYL